MPLESLNNEQINIHDLTIEEEKKPMPEWQKQYEALKETKLYDEVKDQWNQDIHEDQTLANSNRETDAQLIDVLTKSQINKSLAQEKFDLLKETAFFNKDKQQWNFLIDKYQTLRNYSYFTNTQLFGILVEAQFNKSSARKMYNSLKQGPLYNSVKQQWNESVDENQILKNAYHYSNNQLLGILVESQFNWSSAQKQYEALKQSSFYNKDNQLWNRNVDEKDKLIGDNSDADVQLLGTLVESQFNQSSAKNHYEALKKSNLYDKQKKQWHHSLWLDQSRKDSNRQSTDQLLGILCEKEFEKEDNDIINSTPPLPEERNY